MAYDPENSFLINSLPVNANQFQEDSEAVNSDPSILVWNTDLNVLQRISTKTNEVLNETALPLPYRSYTALLSQAGTDAPVATILENTLGVTPVWSYAAEGQYNLTSAGAFDMDKTTISVGNYPDTLSYSRNVNGNILRVETKLDATMALANDCLNRTMIEIRVYN